MISIAALIIAEHRAWQAAETRKESLVEFLADEYAETN